MVIKVQAFLLIIGASTTLTDAFSTSAITLAVKFKEGLSSSFEFTEAQRQLYTMQQNYLQSITSFASQYEKIKSKYKSKGKINKRIYVEVVD